MTEVQRLEAIIAQLKKELKDTNAALGMAIKAAVGAE
jgi:hypothetical protein